MGYRRVLLKLSGEALQGAQPHGVDRKAVETFARGIMEARNAGVEIAVLVGGGNLFRGAELREQGYGRATGDSIGMLGTVINGLALQDMLEALGAETRLATSLKMDEVAEPYIRRRAIRHLERGRIVLLAGGLGRPYISTDTAAVQRALELGADAVLKGTRVKGVYDRDPEQDSGAKFYDVLSFDQAIRDNLRVLDQTAFALCRDNNLPLIVFNLFEERSIARAARGEPIGTLVNSAGERPK